MQHFGAFKEQQLETYIDSKHTHCLRGTSESPRPLSEPLPLQKTPVPSCTTMAPSQGRQSICNKIQKTAAQKRAGRQVGWNNNSSTKLAPSTSNR